MKKLFDIVALADKPDYQLKDNGTNMSPVEIILAGAGILQGILGIFGGGSRRLTANDWQKLFPANGYWTNRLRTYLSMHIHWDTDLKNVQPFTKYFVHENLSEITGGKYFNLQHGIPESEWNKIMTDFYNMLNSEGGYAQNAGGMMGAAGDFLPWLLVGGLAIYLFTKAKK